MSTQPNEALKPLTGVRIFLCFVVITTNFIIYGDMDPGFYRPFAWNYDILKTAAALCVDIFFMLTGFLLYHHYRDIFFKNITFAALRDFMVTRVARIYPVYALSLVCILALSHIGVWGYSGVVSADRVSIPYSWIYNFSIATMWTGAEFKIAWNGPAWSISAEFMNYLMLPFIMLFVHHLMKGWRPLWALIALFAYYMLMQELYIQSYTVDYGLKTIVRANFGVMSGIFIYGLYLKLKDKNFAYDHLFSATTLITLALISIDYAYRLNIPKITYWALIVAFMLFLTLVRGYMHDFLSKRPLLELGKIAFAMYIFHQLVSRTMNYWFSDRYTSVGGHEWGLAALYTIEVNVACFIVAAAVYYLFENPVRYGGRRLFGVKRERLHIK